MSCISRRQHGQVHGQTNISLWTNMRAGPSAATRSLESPSGSVWTKSSFVWFCKGTKVARFTRATSTWQGEDSPSPSYGASRALASSRCGRDSSRRFTLVCTEAQAAESLFEVGQLHSWNQTPLVSLEDRFYDKSRKAPSSTCLGCHMLTGWVMKARKSPWHTGRIGESWRAAGLRYLQIASRLKLSGPRCQIGSQALWGNTAGSARRLLDAALWHGYPRGDTYLQCVGRHLQFFQNSSKIPQLLKKPNPGTASVAAVTPAWISIGS